MEDVNVAASGGQAAGRKITNKQGARTKVDIRIGEGRGDGGVVIGVLFNGPVHFHLSVSDLPDEEVSA